MRSFLLRLRVHIRTPSDGIQYGRVRGQSYQPFHVVAIRLDLEIDTDVGKALRHIVGKPQETAQVNVAFVL